MVPALSCVLRDEELSLRPFEEDDAPTLVAGRDGEFHRFLGEGSPNPRPIACICVGDVIVGWIDYDRDDRAWLADDEVNVGYNVFPGYRGNGFGTRALRLIRAHLARLDPQLRATLLIDPSNKASLALANNAGFREVARIGDQVLWK